MTEQTSLFAYEPETTAEVVKRVQAVAADAVNAQGVTLDV